MRLSRFFHGTSAGQLISMISVLQHIFSIASADLPFRGLAARPGSVLPLPDDVREYSLAALREKIGVVPQNVQLFLGSVRDNIKVGKKEAKDDLGRREKEKRYIQAQA